MGQSSRYFWSPSFPVLVAEVAPLEAAFPPPAEHFEPALVASKWEELDVVDAAHGLVALESRRVPVRRDQDGVFAQLVEERRWVPKEHQVGVQVRDQLDVGVLFERVEADGGCGRQQVVDAPTGRLDREELSVVRLQLRERDGDEVRQRQPVEYRLRLVVHAEHSQPELLAHARERVVEREPAHGVAGVEERAELVSHGVDRRAASNASSSRIRTAYVWSRSVLA